MSKLYIVNILDWNNYESVVVTIHTNLESAEKAKAQYEKNSKENRYDVNYEIVEVPLDYSKEIIYDSCDYDNLVFNEE